MDAGVHTFIMSSFLHTVHKTTQDNYLGLHVQLLYHVHWCLSRPWSITPTNLRRYSKTNSFAELSEMLTTIYCVSCTKLLLSLCSSRCDRRGGGGWEASAKFRSRQVL